MPVTRRGAHEAVDEETREQDELAGAMGVPIFLQQDVREDRWVLVDTSGVDTRCGKPKDSGTREMNWNMRLRRFG